MIREGDADGTNMKKTKVWKWLWYGVLFVLLIFALTRLDMPAMWGSVTHIPPWILAALAGLQIITQLLVNIQWYQAAKFSGTNISFRNMFLINCQGAVVDSITPGVKVGGEVTRAVQISRIAGCSGGQAAAIVGVQKLFSFSAFIFILLLSAGFVINDTAVQTQSMHFVIYGFLVVVLLLIAYVFIFPRKILSFINRREDSARGPKTVKLVRVVRNMFDGLIHFRSNSKAWVLQLVLSFVIWLLYPVKMYLLGIQFDPGASFIFLGAATFVSYMVAMIPIFPGGLGGFEATMAGLLIVGGFQQSDAVVIAVVFRFLTFWLVMLGSLVFVGIDKMLKIKSTQTT